MENNATEPDRVIRDRLLEFGRSINPQELTPTRKPEAAELLKEDPFAFILAICLDRGTRAEIIWTIPYWLRSQLGHLDPKRMSKMKIEDLAAAIEHLPKKPRYVGDAPRTIRELAQIVANEFGGDAEQIWKGRNAQEVVSLLMRVHGVGEGIASMAVALLRRCRGVQFPDQNAMNVKPDVHVRRVLYRLGVARDMCEAEVLRAAERLNRKDPAALDAPLWVIGRRWCKKTDPDCEHCHMRCCCARRGL